MKKRRPSRPAALQPKRRKNERAPWNTLNVQLELHFCPTLQRAWGKPAVVLESFDLIYPKLHAEERD